MKMSRPIMTAFAVLLSVTAIPSVKAQNVPPGLLPAGANTTNPSAPFYIDLTDLDFKTNPPTRSPLNPNYPPATTLPDGVLPVIGANGNFIIGPSHNPAPETLVNRGVPTRQVYSFVIHSK